MNNLIIHKQIKSNLQTFITEKKNPTYYILWPFGIRKKTCITIFYSKYLQNTDQY